MNLEKENGVRAQGGLRRETHINLAVRVGKGTDHEPLHLITRHGIVIISNCPQQVHSAISSK